jgi:hypothetical protein
MKTFLQKKGSERYKRQNSIDSCRSMKQSPPISLFSSNNDMPIQRKLTCPCGGGCPRCEGMIQPKLMINQPGDKYEEEADRMADKVMLMPEPQALSRGRHLTQRVNPTYGEKGVQRQPLEEELRRQPEEKEEEEILRTKGSSDQTAEVTPDIESNIQSLRGGGHSLPASTRAFFESRFGYDFSQVRVHSDTKANSLAESINARAFTIGKNIFFSSGQDASETYSGKHLLAHELTHVMQQGTRKVSSPGERSLSRMGSIRQIGSPFQLLQRQFPLPMISPAIPVVDDTKVQKYIDDAVKWANGNLSLASTRITALRNAPNNPENCFDYSLAAAGHYLFARSEVASGAYSYSRMVAAILLYSLVKSSPLGVMIPRAGRCPVSPTSVGEIKWGLKGASAGKDDFERSRTGRMKIP